MLASSHQSVELVHLNGQQLRRRETHEIGFDVPGALQSMFLGSNFTATRQDLVPRVHKRRRRKSLLAEAEEAIKDRPSTSAEQATASVHHIPCIVDLNIVVSAKALPPEWGREPKAPRIRAALYWVPLPEMDDSKSELSMNRGVREEEEEYQGMQPGDGSSQHPQRVVSAEQVASCSRVQVGYATSEDIHVPQDANDLVRHFTPLHTMHYLFCGVLFPLVDTPHQARAASYACYPRTLCASAVCHLSSCIRCSYCWTRWFSCARPDE